MDMAVQKKAVMPEGAEKVFGAMPDFPEVIRRCAKQSTIAQGLSLIEGDFNQYRENCDRLGSSYSAPVQEYMLFFNKKCEEYFANQKPTAKERRNKQTAE